MVAFAEGEPERPATGRWRSEAAYRRTTLSMAAGWLNSLLKAGSCTGLISGSQAEGQVWQSGTINVGKEEGRLNDWMGQIQICNVWFT